MAEDGTFADLLHRVRAGDQQAAAELVRSYEPEIRREIRFRLRDARLRRIVDSMDICQSVLGSFFLRAASGQYEIAQPGDLIRLLVTLARNKVKDQVRHHRSLRRDNRRVAASCPEELALPADAPSPSQQVAGEELLREFRQRLSPEERLLVELRQQECEWTEIAARLGGTAEGRRKQLARTIDRIARELGLDEGSHE